MYEHIADRIGIIERNDQLFDILDNQCKLGGCNNDGMPILDEGEARSIDALQEFIGEKIVMAYEAGRHSITCNREPHPTCHHGYGMDHAIARGYAKDKGFLI